uniref:Protein kinase domain-containing protein n=1 Tax=Macrostomum lignano TaxID=282301 RepID=A0A1I8IZH1_9PLAT
KTVVLVSDDIGAVILCWGVDGQVMEPRVVSSSFTLAVWFPASAKIYDVVAGCLGCLRSESAVLPSEALPGHQRAALFQATNAALYHRAGLVRPSELLRRQRLQLAGHIVSAYRIVLPREARRRHPAGGAGAHGLTDTGVSDSAGGVAFIRDLALKHALTMDFLSAPSLQAAHCRPLLISFASDPDVIRNWLTRVCLVDKTPNSTCTETSDDPSVGAFADPERDLYRRFGLNRSAVNSWGVAALHHYAQLSACGVKTDKPADVNTEDLLQMGGDFLLKVEYNGSGSDAECRLVFSQAGGSSTDRPSIDTILAKCREYIPEPDQHIASGGNGQTQQESPGPQPGPQKPRSLALGGAGRLQTCGAATVAGGGGRQEPGPLATPTGMPRARILQRCSSIRRPAASRSRVASAATVQLAKELQVLACQVSKERLAIQRTVLATATAPSLAPMSLKRWTSPEIQVDLLRVLLVLTQVTPVLKTTTCRIQESLNLSPTQSCSSHGTKRCFQHLVKRCCKSSRLLRMSNCPVKVLRKRTGRAARNVLKSVQMSTGTSKCRTVCNVCYRNSPGRTEDSNEACSNCQSPKVANFWVFDVKNQLETFVSARRLLDLIVFPAHKPVANDVLHEANSELYQDYITSIVPEDRSDLAREMCYDGFAPSDLDSRHEEYKETMKHPVDIDDEAHKKTEDKRRLASVFTDEELASSTELHRAFTRCGKTAREKLGYPKRVGTKKAANPGTTKPDATNPGSTKPGGTKPGTTNQSTTNKPSTTKPSDSGVLGRPTGLVKEAEARQVDASKQVVDISELDGTNDMPNLITGHQRRRSPLFIRRLNSQPHTELPNVSISISGSSSGHTNGSLVNNHPPIPLKSHFEQLNNRYRTIRLCWATELLRRGNATPTATGVLTSRSGPGLTEAGERRSPNANIVRYGTLRWYSWSCKLLTHFLVEDGAWLMLDESGIGIAEIWVPILLSRSIGTSRSNSGVNWCPETGNQASIDMLEG